MLLGKLHFDAAIEAERCPIPERREESTEAEADFDSEPELDTPLSPPKPINRGAAWLRQFPDALHLDKKEDRRALKKLLKKKPVATNGGPEFSIRLVPAPNWLPVRR